VRQATSERAIDHPVALDNDYDIWSGFDNHYWPALYFVDADGVIRDQHFGEGRHEQSERVSQRLLGVEREPVSVEGLGVEAEADWDNLRTPEAYLRSGRGEHFASPDGAAFDERRACSHPAHEDRFPSAYSSTARLRARHTAWTSTRTGTACSGRAASTSSYTSTTGSMSGRWRSRSSSPAPRRTRSRSARYAG
jgi:hypothetical protein